MEKFAQSTCNNCMQKEFELSGEGIADRPDPVNLTASFDMGWQCKGSGKSYNSKSGHAVLIGQKSGKILNYATRIGNCRQCEVNKSVPHDCRMNWGGSSKAMESDTAVGLLNSTQSPEYRVTTIINDEDSTTMARIADEVDHDVEKNSDVNHCKKTVGNDLYKLKPKFSKILTVSTIKHIQRCFSYAVKQNKDKPEDTKLALLNIVPHLYNEHGNCSEWCNHKSDPGAKYLSLPYGQPLYLLICGLN